MATYRPKLVGAGLLDGSDVRSTSRRGAVAIARRRGTVVVEFWRLRPDGSRINPPPTTSDARDWDLWRNSLGYSGIR